MFICIIHIVLLILGLVLLSLSYLSEQSSASTEDMK